MTIGILIRTNMKDGKKGILDQVANQVVSKNKDLRIETLTRELQVNNAAELFFRTFNQEHTGHNIVQWFIIINIYITKLSLTASVDVLPYFGHLLLEVGVVTIDFVDHGLLIGERLDCLETLVDHSVAVLDLREQDEGLLFVRTP